ncbi:MAG: glutaredoxin domain-containing protein [Gammaproteobacteria bacterium]|jgi:glutaredoxin 3
MSRVKVYSTGMCPICDNTKNLLKKWQIPYEELRVDTNRDLLREMLAISEGMRRVPQITIDGEWIGGFSELTLLHMEGRLKELVTAADTPASA